MSGFAIGIDIGGTYLRAGLVTQEGNIISKIKEKVPRYSLVERITKIVEGFDAEKARAIGIGVAGPIEGEVINPPNLPFEKLNLLRPLRERLGPRVYLVNDCVAGLIAESKLGLGRGKNNVIYLAIGTGIGAGVMVDGHILSGKDGNAHEVGHIVVDYEGRLRCGCGGIGHWEAYCSGLGIVKLAMYMANKLNGPLGMKPEDIFRLARGRDEAALCVLKECHKVNTAGLATLMHVYDPELIIIGGGIALNNWDLFIEPSLKDIKKFTIFDPPAITPSKLGEYSAVLGSALHALSKVLEVGRS